MRQHPVGIRCKECALETRLPTFQVSRAYYVRGISAAIGLGFAGLIALSMISQIIPVTGFFFFLLMALLGYLIGDGLGYAINQRRGRPYQYMAISSVLLATAPIALLSLFTFSFGTLLNLVGIGIALSVAWQRRAQ